jgi:dUTP pyrophosphatase
MEQNEFQEYLKKLQEIEKNLSEDDDDLDIEFIEDIENILTKLNKEINLSKTENTNQYSYSIDVNIKKLNESAVIPTYAKDGDAGMDLVATEILSNTTFDVTYGTGIALEVPKGFVGLVFPRSSVRKYDLTLSNSVGVIDSGYRGELQVTFKKTNGLDSLKYNVGDRIAQIMILPYPKINFKKVDNLSDSERGEGGFGSTGK